MNTRTRIVAGLLTGALAVACGKSKVDQCNAFIDRANAAQTVVNALSVDHEDAKKLEEQAGKIEAEAKQLQGVELKDETLVKFKTDYAGNLTKLATNVRDLAKLNASAKDPSKAAGLEAQAKKLEADSDKLEKDESKLVGEINQYCSSSK